VVASKAFENSIFACGRLDGQGRAVIAQCDEYDLIFRLSGNGDCTDALCFAGVESWHIEKNFAAHTFSGLGKCGIKTFDEYVDGSERELQFDGLKRHRIVCSCAVR